MNNSCGTRRLPPGETLGLDPEDPDWWAIGRDWVKPKEEAARTRLYEKLIRLRQETQTRG